MAKKKNAKTKPSKPQQPQRSIAGMMRRRPSTPTMPMKGY